MAAVHRSFTSFQMVHTHTHTCSEMSYRIVDVESIGRAKATQLNLTGMIYIYIYIVTSQLRTTAPRDCHSSAQLWPPPKGFAVQGHCLQVRLHGSRGGVFIGHRPPRDPGGPLQIRSFTSIQVHTHALPQQGR